MQIIISNKNTKNILIGSFIFAIIMIIILHAALTCIIRSNLEHSANILVQQMSYNIYSTNEEGVAISNSDFSSEPENNNYLRFILQSLEFIKNYPAAKINIYNAHKRKIISSNSEEINKANEYNLMDYIAKSIINEDSNPSNEKLSSQINYPTHYKDNSSS
jgi:hypothetical protein